MILNTEWCYFCSKSCKFCFFYDINDCYVHIIYMYVYMFWKLDELFVLKIINYQNGEILS